MASARNPPRYIQGVYSPTKTRNPITVMSEARPSPVMSQRALGVTIELSRPGRQNVASAAPISNPIACESVPK